MGAPDLDAGPYPRPWHLASGPLLFGGFALLLFWSQLSPSGALNLRTQLLETALVLGAATTALLPYVTSPLRRATQLSIGQAGLGVATRVWTFTIPWGQVVAMVRNPFSRTWTLTYQDVRMPRSVELSDLLAAGVLASGRLPPGPATDGRTGVLRWVVSGLAASAAASGLGKKAGERVLLSPASPALSDKAAAMAIVGFAPAVGVLAISISVAAGEVTALPVMALGYAGGSFAGWWIGRRVRSPKVFWASFFAGVVAAYAPTIALFAAGDFMLLLSSPGLVAFGLFAVAIGLVLGLIMTVMAHSPNLIGAGLAHHSAGT